MIGTMFRTEWLDYWFFCTVGLVLAILIARPRHLADLKNYGAVFLALQYATYVLRPVLSVLAGNGFTIFEGLLPGITLMATEDTVPMALIFGASMVCFALVYRRFQRPAAEPEAPGPEAARGSRVQESRARDSRWLFTRLALVLVAVGYGSFLIAQRGFLGLKQSGIEYVATQGGTGFANTSGYIELANYFVLAGVVVYYAASGKLLRSIVLALPWSLNQVYQGWGRNMLLSLVLAMFAVSLVHQRFHKDRRRRLILAFAIALLIGFLILGMRSNRFFLQRGIPLLSLFGVTSSTPVDEVLGDFAGFEGSWYAYEVLDSRTPRYGASVIYELLIKPIPRALWTGKPFPGEFTWDLILSGRDDTIYSTVIGTESIWYTGSMRGGIGSALSEFGYLGIAINFGLIGLLFATMERRVDRAESSPVDIAAYAVTYGMVSLLGRAPLFGGHLITYLLIFYLPYAFIGWWVKSQQRRLAHRWNAGSRWVAPAQSNVAAPLRLGDAPRRELEGE